MRASSGDAEPRPFCSGAESQVTSAWMRLPVSGSSGAGAMIGELGDDALADGLAEADNAALVSTLEEVAALVDTCADELVPAGVSR